MKRNYLSLVLTLLIVLTQACSLRQGEMTGSPRVNDTPVTIAQPSPTDTPESPQQLIFIDRLSGWDGFRDELNLALEHTAQEHGWNLQAYQIETEPRNFPEAVLIVVLGGEEDPTSLLERNPEAKFLLIGVSNASPGERVAVIGPEGMRTDQIAFLSGYISAMITADWRMGIIGVGDTSAEQAALTSFINGGVFFCGLCRPAYPPFQEYPTSVTVPDYDSESIAEGLEALEALAVTTIGLTPVFNSGAVDLAMGEAKNNRLLWIGPNPPDQENRSRWIATIRPDPSSAIVAILPRLLTGEPDLLMPMPIKVVDVNEAILTEGKLRIVLEVRDALVLGTIDSGVDPQTGLER